MTTDTLLFFKWGQQSLLLYVNLSITQPPVDGLNSNFACRAQMGSSFFSDNFFVLTLFGWHEVKLPLPMFLRQEASNLASLMYLALNLMVSGIKNRGRCNFTSCQPNRVNTKKLSQKTRPHLCPTCKISVQSVNWGLSYGRIHIQK